MADRSPVPAWLNAAEVEPSRRGLGFVGRLALAVQCYHTPGMFAETQHAIRAVRAEAAGSLAGKDQEIVNLRTMLAHAEHDAAFWRRHAEFYQQRVSCYEQEIMKLWETSRQEQQQAATARSVAGSLAGKDQEIASLRTMLAQAEHGEEFWHQQADRLWDDAQARYTELAELREQRDSILARLWALQQQLGRRHGLALVDPADNPSPEPDPPPG